MTPPVSDSVASSSDPKVLAGYQDATTLTRRAAKNFYYAFCMLPADQHRALCALYAFMRQTDDLGDADEPVDHRRDALARWRDTLDRVLTDGPNDQDAAWWHAFADMARRFEVPPLFFHAVIDGCETDLTVTRYASFEPLNDYCYNVASVVGLACIRLWGVPDDRADAAAEACGIAFQLTNILRDVVEDYGRGRVYLPQDDMALFGVTDAMLQGPPADPRFISLMHYEIDRARRYYQEAASLAGHLPPPGRAVLRVMTGIYRGLLERIARDPSRVLRGRTRLPRWRKWAIVAAALPTRFAR